MRLAAGCAQVAIKRRAAEPDSKEKSSLYIKYMAKVPFVF
jgi:hypothetical protein